MEILRDEPVDGPVIAGFAGRGFRVRQGDAEQVHAGGIILTPLSVQDWAHEDAGVLGAAHLDFALTLDRQPEFLLLGTGAQLVHPPRALIRALEDRGMGVEVMDSRAAARAWGVLRSEGRWISAALMPL